MAGLPLRETELYAPVKAFLEQQGFTVKAEIGAADVVACRSDLDAPVIVELKTGFSLALFHQAVARLTVTDLVYVAVPRKPGRGFSKSMRANATLARRLGLGVLVVRAGDGHVEALCDPGPYAPRKSAKRRDRLLREFQKREGDPNTGGATRSALVTAYRQDALRCAGFLAQNGASKGGAVAKASGVATATRLMADNHYGWFHRVSRGVYALTETGQAALEAYQSALPVPPAAGSS